MISAFTRSVCDIPLNKNKKKITKNKIEQNRKMLGAIPCLKFPTLNTGQTMENKKKKKKNKRNETRRK